LFIGCGCCYEQYSSFHPPRKRNFPFRGKIRQTRHPFIAAQWRHALRDVNVTEAFDGKKLLKHLLTLRTTSEAPLRDRILGLDHEITALDATIAAREAELNAITYQLYRLTPEEIAMVEGG
jgi:hypothetical protein